MIQNEMRWWGTPGMTHERPTVAVNEKEAYGRDEMGNRRLLG